MNIRIVRQYDARLKPIGDLTTQNWASYADRHGYGLIQKKIGGQLDEPNRKKLFAVHDEILKYGYDWLFWADADTVVTNPEIKLESFIERFSPEHHLVFDVSHYGLSTGNFFARNSELASELLLGVMLCGDVTREVNSRFATINGYDESSLKLLIESFPRYQKHVGTIKIADFPAQHTASSFILHCAQRTEEERIKLLTPYCQ